MSDNLPSWMLVGFTGHRKITDPKPIAQAIHAILQELEITLAPLAAVSSAASGADTQFIAEVARRGLPYFLIFPFAEERFRQDFSAEEWDRVAAHFAGALSIDEVRDVDSANEAYLECGIRTVDRADVLVAVWNGQPAAGKGGTGDVVDYARKLGKPLIWIDAVTGDRRTERLDQLPRRERQTATADDGPSLPPRDLVVKQYTAFDTHAERNAPKTRQLIQYIIRLHLVATALGITGYVLGLHGLFEQLFGAFELAALSTALYLASRHRRAHHEWMSARVAAEMCRSFLACWPMRRRGANLPTLAFDDQDELARSLRMAWYLDRQAEQPLEEARDTYLKGRVHDQMEYFQKKYRSAGNRAVRLKYLAMSATIAAIVFGVIALSVSFAGYHDWVFKMPKLGAMLLPLIPPAILSLVVAHDLSRRAERYRDVTAKLQQVEERLKAVRTWPGLWREVNRCENLLLQEVAEWYALTRFAADSH